MQESPGNLLSEHQRVITLKLFFMSSWETISMPCSCLWTRQACQIARFVLQLSSLALWAQGMSVLLFLLLLSFFDSGPCGLYPRLAALAWPLKPIGLGFGNATCFEDGLQSTSRTILLRAPLLECFMKCPRVLLQGYLFNPPLWSSVFSAEERFAARSREHCPMDIGLQHGMR